jgi:cell shape-determining protein MreD
MKKKLQRAKLQLKKLVAYTKAHKAQTFQSALLVYLVVRVEQLHHLFQNFQTLTLIMATSLLDRLVAADIQFKMAIHAILSLFGGDGSAS